MLGTAASFRPPTARLRLRRPSDARSAERGEPMPFLCARHRRHAMVSSALFAFLEGARRIGRVLRVCAALGTAPLRRERGVKICILAAIESRQRACGIQCNHAMDWCVKSRSRCCVCLPRGRGNRNCTVKNERNESPRLRAEGSRVHERPPSCLLLHATLLWGTQGGWRRVLCSRRRQALRGSSI